MKPMEISNTDKNADWIRALPGYKDEIKIHDRLAKKLGKKEEGGHIPLYIDAACPLCGEFGADYYAGHKGLLICRSCKKTFDPSVEP